MKVQLDFLPFFFILVLCHLYSFCSLVQKCGGYAFQLFICTQYLLLHTKFDLYIIGIVSAPVALAPSSLFRCQKRLHSNAYSSAILLRCLQLQYVLDKYSVASIPKVLNNQIFIQLRGEALQSLCILYQVSAVDTATTTQLLYAHACIHLLTLLHSSFPLLVHSAHCTL